MRARRAVEPSRAGVPVEGLVGRSPIWEPVALAVAVPPKATFTIGLTGVALSSGELPLVPAELVAVTT